MVSIVVVVPHALAAPAKILGRDDMSCVAWLATKGDPEQRSPYIEWLRGFLSGHNYASPTRQVSVVSSGTIAVYIDRHCSEKSSSTLTDAVMRMSDEYSGRNAPIVR